MTKLSDILEILNLTINQTAKNFKVSQTTTKSQANSKKLDTDSVERRLSESYTGLTKYITSSKIMSLSEFEENHIKILKLELSDKVREYRLNNLYEGAEEYLIENIQSFSDFRLMNFIIDFAVFYSRTKLIMIEYPKATDEAYKIACSIYPAQSLINIIKEYAVAAFDYPAEVMLVYVEFILKHNHNQDLMYSVIRVRDSLELKKPDHSLCEYTLGLLNAKFSDQYPEVCEEVGEIVERGLRGI